MAVQVAQAADPNANAAMLSPVSKLEAARKEAALEQQRRVEVAVKRMTEIKTENAGKRKLLEEKLDAHAKLKVQKTTAVSVSVSTKTKRSAAVETAAAVEQQQQQLQHRDEEAITKKLADKFDSVEGDKTVAQQVDSLLVVIDSKYSTRKQQTTAVSANYDATHELLRATRNKLEGLVSEDQSGETPATEETKSGEPEGDWNGPSTNYHLKQLGLVKKKIDIYAPVEVQQQEIRRLRDRSRFASTTIVEAIDDHDSEDDSDFTPEVEEESEGEDSDAESIPEVEAEETLELVREAEEHEKKLRQRAALVKIPLYVIFFCILVIAALGAVEIAQQQYEFCSIDVQSADESAVVSCGSFLQAREAIKRFVLDSTACVRESTAASIAAIHSRFQEL